MGIPKKMVRQCYVIQFTWWGVTASYVKTSLLRFLSNTKEQRKTSQKRQNSNKNSNHFLTLNNTWIYGIFLHTLQCVGWPWDSPSLAFKTAKLSSAIAMTRLEDCARLQSKVRILQCSALPLLNTVCWAVECSLLGLGFRALKALPSALKLCTNFEPSRVRWSGLLTHCPYP